VTLTVSIEQFPVSGPESGPYGITGARPHAIAVDAYGDCWFTEWGANRVGRITAAGLIDEYELPTLSSEPHGIVAGPDGALWVALEIGALARLTTGISR
jgi:virginiamycin B lyase